MLKNEKLENVDFSDALGERYLEYALSTIMSRSLPDVRDGLKPVHRRLLYAMHQLKLDPKSAYKKCARIVGDVIGKYHPHGDVAVYDTLARLAQNFSLRYPLIDGQGNFGSIDGDNPAAMRYTESRLTDIALFLLQDIEKNTVDFRLNYDDSDEEPSLLPAHFPNLLANGSEGIAVGMATSIPPHNLSELCDGLIMLIDNEEASVSDLLQVIKGPDFPTGGVIVDDEKVINEAYSTGRGSFRLRAKWYKESLNHGLYQIIVTEIPYQVHKSKIIEKIADLLREKKLPLLANLRDESTDDIRIVLEPKTRSSDAEMLMNVLFKLTDLEIRFNMNLNVLDSKLLPRVMNLKEVLKEFLAHKHILVIRRSKFLLEKVTNRLEILAAFKIAYLNLDEIIRIIREEDEPKNIMMAKFLFNDNQAEAILNMRLRSLRKLEEIEILKEMAELELKKDELLKILNDDSYCQMVIKNEILQIKEQFNLNTHLGARRTVFDFVKSDSSVLNIEALIEREPITIFCSLRGWIRSIKGHIPAGETNVKYKDGDGERFLLHTYTTDNILIFSQKGKFFTILADNIPKGKGQGDAIRLIIEMDDDDDIVSMFVYNPSQRLLLLSNSGKGFITDSKDVVAHTKCGKQVLVLADGFKAHSSNIIEGDMLALIGSNRKMLICKISDIPTMKRGQGVTIQKYKQAILEDAKIFSESEGLSWKLGERVRLESNILSWLAKRGSSGKLPPTGFPKNNKFS